MTDANRHTGIRALGEGDRSLEFIAGRNQLIDSINEWLQDLAQKRDAIEPLADGLTIMDKPRITQTFLGKTAIGLNMMGVDTYAGVSLSGDGVMTPLKLQSVRKNSTDNGYDVIEAQGSDPIARQFSDGTYGVQNSAETVASFSLTDAAQDSKKPYFGYEFKGDGSVIRKFVDTQGVHNSQRLREAEEIQVAAQAFEQVQSQFDI